MKNSKTLLAIVPFLLLSLIVGSAFINKGPHKQSKLHIVADPAISPDGSTVYLCSGQPGHRVTFHIDNLPTGATVDWTAFDCNIQGATGTNPSTKTAPTVTIFANVFSSASSTVLQAVINVPGQSPTTLSTTVDIITCP